MSNEIKFQVFAREVAEALGGYVNTEDRGNLDFYASIALPDVQIDMHTGGQRGGKVAVSLPVLRWRDAEGNHQYAIARDSLDYNERQNGFTLEINVSMARGAAAVAKDITRRLLPNARLVWARMLARRNSAMEYSDATVATRNRLAALTGSDARGNTFYLNGASLTVQGEKVRFERLGNVSLATALKMVELLKADAAEEAA